VILVEHGELVEFEQPQVERESKREPATSAGGLTVTWAFILLLALVIIVPIVVVLVVRRQRKAEQRGFDALPPDETRGRK
jgi:hypothetical protein